nr:MAG TPA: hypothetical protein [Caudoviricetes sp.]
MFLVFGDPVFSGFPFLCRNCACAVMRVPM